jgi:hypothetical protein
MDEIKKQIHRMQDALGKRQVLIIIAALCAYAFALCPVLDHLVGHSISFPIFLAGGIAISIGTLAITGYAPRTPTKMLDNISTVRVYICDLACNTLGQCVFDGKQRESDAIFCKRDAIARDMPFSDFNKVNKFSMTGGPHDPRRYGWGRDG